MTSSLSLGSSVAAVPVDIPDSWDPRTKQQPTGLIACRLRAAVLIRQRSLLHRKRASCIGKSMQEACYYHIMREP